MKNWAMERELSCACAVHVQGDAMCNTNTYDDLLGRGGE